MVALLCLASKILDYHIFNQINGTAYLNNGVLVGEADAALARTGHTSIFPFIELAGGCKAKDINATNAGKI